MEQYNYYEAVKNDVMDYLKETDERDYEKLYDDMFISDNVTGNASGSYYCNTWDAEEALCHNLDLLQEALECFGCGIEYLENGAEACDVTIRCYVLSQVLQEALDEVDQ